MHINGFNISNKIILNNLGIIGIHDIHEKRPVTETSNRKLLIYSIVNIIGSQEIGYGLQYLLYPGDRYGPILGPLIFLIILFVKNLGPSVFLFYGVLLISNGISKIIPNGRSKGFQINNMLGVIKFWVGASLLTSITLGLPFILELISQQFPK